MFELLTCKIITIESRALCRECLLFKRLRDMVLVSGQNEVLLLLLSFLMFLETMFVSRAVTAVGRHVEISFI
jgi:hypothetical protein